jgi:hypothetical protein
MSRNAARTMPAELVPNGTEEGLSLAGLRPMARLRVRTRNTLYRLVLLGPGPTVLVQGGRHFPEPTEVRFCGSSLGGIELTADWIGVGFAMELATTTRHILTSSVCSIEVEDESVYGPF